MKMKSELQWMMYIWTGWDNMNRELKKLIHNPLIVLVIVSFLMISFVKNIYVLTNRDIQIYDEAIEQINEDYQNGIIHAGMDTPSFNDYVGTLSLKYDSSFVYEYIYDRLSEKLLTYDTDLDTEENIIKNKLNSDLYSSDDDQKKLNKEMEIITYKQNIDIQFTNDILYLSILDDQMIMTLLFILIGIILSYYLFIRDQDTKMLSLYSSTKRGIRKIFVDKMIILLFTMISIYVIKFCLECICLSRNNFDFEIPLQMIYGYPDSIICLNVGQYLVLVEGMHLCMTILFISLFLMLYQYRKNITGTLLILGGTLLIEYLMFHFISLVSQFAFLKEYNFFYIIGIGSNHFFKYQFDTLLYITSGIILITCILIILFHHSYCNCKKQKTFMDTGIHFKTGSLFLYQLTDIFVMKKYVFVILILLGYSCYDYKTYTTVKSYDEKLTENLRYEYAGEITSGKLKQLEDERYRIENARNELDALNEKMWTSGITEEEQNRIEQLSSIVSNQNAFETVYDEIQTTFRNGGNEYIDHTGLELLFMTDSSIYQFILFFLILIPSLLFGAVQGENKYRSNITELICTSKNKLKYNIQLIINSFMHSILLVLIVYGARYFKITKYYSINIISSSTNNYFAINNTLNIKVYLLLSFLNMILLFSSLNLMTSLLTKKMSLIYSFLISLLLACILFFLPVGIHSVACIGTSSFNTLLIRQFPKNG